MVMLLRSTQRSTNILSDNYSLQLLGEQSKMHTMKVNVQQQ